MSDNKLQKRVPSVIKEKAQYFLAFGVIVVMLLAAEFPVFVIFFFGVFAYFLTKLFSAGSRNETREIFEFYLSANEMLRDDERRWYGFELSETIGRGEGILQRMNSAPPLVSFTLGALYNKAGDHSSAVNHLIHVLENDAADESAYAFPSPELRSYVKVLRKIERDPADAPMTSAAVRALERARRIRGKALLEDSRTKLSAATMNAAHELSPAAPQSADHDRIAAFVSITAPHDPVRHRDEIEKPSADHSQNGKRHDARRKPKKDPFTDRKPITEVLHDIYDKNIQ